MATTGPQWLARLPGTPYRPGRGNRPAPGFLDRLIATAPAVTVADGWRENPAYLFGFACLVRGYFWEAHEVWEPVWMRALPNSRERLLLRALIQIANALLKQVLDRPAAASRLRAEAAGVLVEVARAGEGTLMGIDPVALARRIGGENGASTRPETLFAGMPITQYIAL